MPVGQPGIFDVLSYGAVYHYLGGVNPGFLMLVMQS